MGWAPGTIIRQEEFDWRRELVTVWAETVVADDPGLLVLYTQSGAPYLSRTMKSRTVLPIEERLAYFAAHNEVAIELRTTNWRILQLYPRRGHHAVWLIWSPEWEFRGWYVNFQRPYIRTERGIANVDLFLDLTVDPAGEWSWKDQDEFEGACRLGLLSPYERRVALAEAGRVIERIERRAAPFDEPWPEWRPDRSWPVPTLGVADVEVLPQWPGRPFMAPRSLAANGQASISSEK